MYSSILPLKLSNLNNSNVTGHITFKKIYTLFFKDVISIGKNDIANPASLYAKLAVLLQFFSARTVWHMVSWILNTVQYAPPYIRSISQKNPTISKAVFFVAS
jgi:hypothetical protein